MNQLRSLLYGREKINPAHSNQPEMADSSKSDAQMASESGIRKAIMRVIPLAPGDCLECKLIGTGVMMLSGVIVISSAMMAPSRSNKIPRSGPRRILYYALCSSLFVSFEAAAFCRLLDLGPFAKIPMEKTKR